MINRQNRKRDVAELQVINLLECFLSGVPIPWERKGPTAVESGAVSRMLLCACQMKIEPRCVEDKGTAR